MQDFRNIDAWQRAHKLALTVYNITRSFPKEEIFGVTMQLRRASVAVPAQIVKACSHDQVSFAQELRKAATLSGDLEYAVVLAGDLGLLEQAQCDQLMQEVIETRKMIFGLARTH